MNKIPGYDESPAYTGEGASLPAGRYVCEIKGVKIARTRNGTEQLVLQLDIAEGEYKGFYEALYRSEVGRKGINAKWSNNALFRQGFGEKQLPFFKGMMTCIEKSNKGFFWGRDAKTGNENWDEKTLKGKRIGVLFGREQFRALDGSLKFATKAAAVRSIEGLEKSEIPKDKLVDGGFADTSGFTDLGDVSEDDLPF